MLNQTLVMSDCLHFSNQDQINPYYKNELIDQKKAIEEHDQIRQIFKQIGCKVISVPSPDDSQDGVYTANWALVRGDKAVLARLPQVRKSEEAHAREILEGLGKTVVEVPESWKFSGQGDALPCGDLLFAGSGYRSDEKAQDFAARTLGFRLIQLRTVPDLDRDGQPVINKVSGWADSFFYDIDLALAIIKRPENGQRGLIAYCRDAFTPESQARLEELTEVDKIIVSLKEAKEGFACNLVSTGKDVAMSAHAPELRHELEKRGLTVHTPEITELAKGGGYIRCTSLAID